MSETKIAGGFVQVETNPGSAIGDGTGQMSHLAGRRLDANDDAQELLSVSDVGTTDEVSSVSTSVEVFDPRYI